ncbi:NAD(P)-dependent oxidoreductase [Rhizobiaceae bacterium]|nr:NAD(P)-dependent oxidoreductase [Rhizobiaceae bacterium]
MKISVVGLGAMGRGVTLRLLERGHTPTVWNRSPEPARALASDGATIAADVSEALAADVTFVVLYDDDAVRSVILDNAHLEAIRPGSVVVGMSTISIALAQELDEAMRAIDAHYVGGLMFGRPDKAEAGELQLAVGGAPAVVERITPILECLGTVWSMGESALDAHAAKLAGNYLIACSIATIGESAAIASSTGAHPGKFLDMITQTLCSAPISKFHAGPIIASEAPDDKAGLDIVLKDVRLGLEQAQSTGIELTIAEAVVERFEASQKSGFGSRSAYGIYEMAKGEKA